MNKKMENLESTGVLIVGAGPAGSVAAALLCQQGQRVLVIDVPEDLQIERTTTRDNTNADGVKAIIAAQMKRADRLDKADDVIVNDKSLAELHAAVDALHQKYLAMANAQ